MHDNGQIECTLKYSTLLDVRVTELAANSHWCTVEKVYGNLGFISRSQLLVEKRESQHLLFSPRLCAMSLLGYFSAGPQTLLSFWLDLTVTLTILWT
jgi:hypothetical protein